MSKPPSRPAADAAPVAPVAFTRAVVFGACGFLGREVVAQLLASGTQVLGIDTKPWPGALPGGYTHADTAAAALGPAAAFLTAGLATAPAERRDSGPAECHVSCSAGQGAMPPGPPSGESRGLPLDPAQAPGPGSAEAPGQVFEQGRAQTPCPDTAHAQAPDKAFGLGYAQTLPLDPGSDSAHVPGPESSQAPDPTLPAAPDAFPFPPIGIPKGRGPLAGVQGAAPPDSPLSLAFFHLAGLADAGACQRDPALARLLNVDLVAEALAVLSGVPCVFVFPSTGIVYGDALGRPAREDDPLLPGAEYARGKIEAEGLVRGACGAGGVLRGAVARLSNLYGPGGGENTVLGRILGQARRGEPLQVWDESPVRDFLYVTDAAQGLIRLGLAACGATGEPTGAGGESGGCVTANLSTGRGTGIGQLIDLCAELFNTSRLPQERDPAQGGGRVSSLVLANSRLAALTGWAPATPLAQGLRNCL